MAKFTEYDEDSMEYIEKEVYIEDSVPLKRLQIESIIKWLELRFPSNYGKRMELTVKTVDLTSALDEARKRLEDSLVNQYVTDDII